jgi:hypothetical protein
MEKRRKLFTKNQFQTIIGYKYCLGGKSNDKNKDDDTAS